MTARRPKRSDPDGAAARVTSGAERAAAEAAASVEATAARAQEQLAGVAEQVAGTLRPPTANVDEPYTPGESLVERNRAQMDARLAEIDAELQNIEPLADQIARALVDTGRQAHASDEPKLPGPDPDAIPWRQLTDAVKFWQVDGVKNMAKISRDTGLSPRKVRRIVQLADAGRLRWTRTGLEGVTRVTRDGAHLPRL